MTILAISNVITSLPTIDPTPHMLMGHPSQLTFPGFKVAPLLLIHKGYYEFEELAEETQEYAIEEYRKNYEPIDCWYELYKEDLATNLEKIGFELKDMYFSGFCSQGDGACFTGHVTDTKKFLKAALFSQLSTENQAHLKLFKMFKKKEYTDYVLNFGCSIKAGNRYSHSGTMDISTDYYFDDNETMFPEYLQDTSACDDLILAYLRDIADEFYKTLEKAYNYEYSDENLKEVLITNEYQFDEDGNII